MTVEQSTHTCPISVQHSQYQKQAEEVLQLILKPNTSSPAMVHIGDPERTRAKLEAIIAQGASAFEVVSDFDFTISKFRHDGIRNPSSHGIFEKDPELTDDARNQLRALANKYFAIEFDPFMPVEEKIPHLLTWGSLTQDIMVQCQLHRSALAKTVRECSLVLRDEVKAFTDLLHERHIPLLIFSAGLGDVIRLLLQRFCMDTENVRVVSNFMRFNEEGVLVGFEEPAIHTFNKTAASITSLANGDGKSSMKRPCVLLLGDSTGDVHMADGATVDDPEGVRGTVLRIGFLNDLIDTQLEKYKLLYDIVLTYDDTFRIPLTVIRTLFQCWETPVQNGLSE
ncbi:Cytosolic 5' nucleotidase III [Fasciola hepatica]|uniref:5'-nucleotidase n=1 Tax=Fasciola hepatica TaxID=6192 RepID=A0A4E0S2Y6_FASHE|nr:Cytosolic 5' nucleotidase III [Fasciola hepatica]